MPADTTFEKDAEAVLDYGVDWSSDGWLADGETITDHTVVIAAAAQGLVGDRPAADAGTATYFATDDGTFYRSDGTTWTDGLTVDSSSEADGIVTVWLSGGTAWERYRVECLITTSGGRTDERSFSLHVKER